MYRLGYSVVFVMCLFSLLTSLLFSNPHPLLVMFTFACFALPYMLWFTDIERKRRIDKIDRAIEGAYDFTQAKGHPIKILIGLALFIGAIVPIFSLAFVSMGTMLAFIALDYVRDPRTLK